MIVAVADVFGLWDYSLVFSFFSKKCNEEVAKKRMILLSYDQWKKDTCGDRRVI